MSLLCNGLADMNDASVNIQLLYKQWCWGSQACSLFLEAVYILRMKACTKGETDCNFFFKLPLSTLLLTMLRKCKIYYPTQSVLTHLFLNVNVVIYPHWGICHVINYCWQPLSWYVAVLKTVVIHYACLCGGGGALPWMFGTVVQPVIKHLTQCACNVMMSKRNGLKGSANSKNVDLN